MKFTILVPTYNNIDYLKILLYSLKKNSSFSHEIILHINEGVDGTLDYIKTKNYKYTYSKTNIGLCSAINSAAKLSTQKYLLYAHDDMYFCPNWDKYLADEVKGIKHNKFYISGTMIEAFTGHITYNCGETIEKFNEKKLLNNYKKLKYHDHQGTHFAPHLIEKKMWKEIGGFSEEFNPGYSSDPDLNMKLWIKGVRIFKGLKDCKVYHFGSVTIHKNQKKTFKRNLGSLANKIFLLKWGISIKFFKKHYLRSHYLHNETLSNPNKNTLYYIELIKNKISFIYYKVFSTIKLK